jgi:hypothetical protein
MSESAAQEQFAQAAPNLGAPTLTDRIRERPLLSAGLAALVGFVAGGGASSRTGTAMLALVARIWLRRAATEAIVNAMSGYGRVKRNGAH